MLEKRQTVSDKLQNKFIILIYLQFNQHDKQCQTSCRTILIIILSCKLIYCQSVLENRQTVSDKLQNKFIILIYLQLN